MKIKESEATKRFGFMMLMDKKMASRTERDFFSSYIFMSLLPPDEAECPHVWPLCSVHF